LLRLNFDIQRLSRPDYLTKLDLFPNYRPFFTDCSDGTGLGSSQIKIGLYHHQLIVVFQKSLSIVWPSAIKFMKSAQDFIMIKILSIQV
jgi:hypothetical protein